MIYKEIERKLNYTAVGLVPDDGHRWGLAFPNRTITGGILKQLYDRNVDIGFCAFWIDFSKLWMGTFSTYWEFECLQFLIPKPKLLPPHWENILKPLPRTVWILVLLCLILVSSTSYVLRHIEEKTVTGGNEHSNNFLYISCTVTKKSIFWGFLSGDRWRQFNN